MSDQSPPTDNQPIIQPFVTIQDEMRQSFMDYAMSVIVSRALPDVRDGLKPVHRRILFAMGEMGMTPDKPFKKSARIVGEVLGKYHPHGDSSVYDAMVRMAQTFSMRQLLVDGQGNFGSVDGDSAAAMRYTEARLKPYATEILADLDCNTVDFTDNFDGSLQEPVVMPAKAPNLLINGVTGIAVGMATEIPPHNLKEVIDATLHLIENPEATVLDLMEYVKGPDFPTGGVILGTRGLREAYETGRGGITVRSKVDFEEGGKGQRDRLVVTEIPYQLNKTRLIEQIADLVQEGKLEGIADLRDESDRNGMRIMIELRRDANSQVVLNNLFMQTRLQSNYNFNMVALVNNQPRILNLREILSAFINHRNEIVRRRTIFFLDKAEARAHLVNGFLTVLDQLDKVIALIRAADSTAEAHEQLMTGFELSDKQASAVLEMQLRRLTGLEKRKLETERDDLNAQITDYQDILANPARVNGIIREELEGLIARFEDGRRTQFEIDPGEFHYTDLIPDDPMAVFMTAQGYIKRLHLDTFEQQKRGGRGISGMQMRDEDYIEHFVTTSAHGTLLFFTNFGKVYGLRVYEVPEASRQSKGNNIVNLLQLQPGEAVTTMLSIEDFSGEFYLTMLTRCGQIKRTELGAFKNIRRAGLIAINLDDDDILGWVKLTDGNQQILIGTAMGMSILFMESDLRALGRGTRGVKAMRLRTGDYIVGMAVPQPGETILTVTTNGYGKRTAVEDYRLQSRNGSGVINIKLRQDGKVSSVLAVDGSEDIIVVTSQGVVIRQHVQAINTYGRGSKGNTVQRLGEGDFIVAVAKIARMSDEEGDVIEDGDEADQAQLAGVSGMSAGSGETEAEQV
ncbi:MAG: DNA gyrase subunit A [Candidatus Melainabacteria bacterium HGW-Melainabacteria-1]|nr:MAG: DNA gyrase subunit A [Candidatus Melainabacteria bacterium HGW-Melainabacteria-1]